MINRVAIWVILRVGLIPKGRRELGTLLLASFKDLRAISVAPPPWGNGVCFRA